MQVSISIAIAFGTLFAVIAGQRGADPYKIEVAQDFANSQSQVNEDPSQSVNNARPSFRQYNTNSHSDYSSQQYGYSNNQQPYQYNPGSQGYSQYDSSQMSGQRYPQYSSSNQNGFQRDSRFNSATPIGSSLALFSAMLMAFMRFVFY